MNIFSTIGKSFENQKGRFEYFINPKDKTKRKSTPSYKTKKKSTPSSSATPTGGSWVYSKGWPWTP
jgi:hypothetical protein